MMAAVAAAFIIPATFGTGTWPIAILVSENVVETFVPVTVAVTLNDPVTLFAVSVQADTNPFASVFTLHRSPVRDELFPENSAIGFVGMTGLLKITCWPLIGLPPLSWTWTSSVS